MYDRLSRFWYLKLKSRKNRKENTVRFRDRNGIKNRILLADEEKDSDGLFVNKIDVPRIIVPWVFNKRIESQHAIFTYSGRKYINKGLKDIEDEMRPWEALDWLEVSAANKSQMKKGVRT